MAELDNRIDNYIKDAAPFAQPVLRHLRKLIHQTCPEVKETLKWGFPHFLYKKKILCSMAAFKAHCAFGFWKGALVVGDSKEKANTAMGQLGRITSVKDLPTTVALKTYLKKAMKLNEAPEAKKQFKRPLKHQKPPIKIPKDFQKALRANKAALATYGTFSPSQKREYIEWIVEAKTEETRERRLETAIDWIADGKSRHWKYQRN
jgi:uncharacterized protein YdeI (YjbR/CyaY-like superfamily)